MKRLLNFISLFAILLGWTTPSHAQFYPDSSANWCLYRLGPPPPEPELNYQFNMPSSPDTIINGVQYKHIERIQNASYPLGLEHNYVRSTPDGNGYIYIPELGSEYLTGKTNVVVGDTVHNVIVADETFTCEQTLIIISPAIFQLVLVDVVVQSVDTLTNGGVTVVRFSVFPLCPGVNSNRFWQLGMGTEFGPLLELSDGLSFVRLVCTNVDSISTFNTNNGPSGLPGGTCFCEAPVPIGIHELIDISTFAISPNPSTGIFTLSSPTIGTTVYTSTGQELFQSTGQAIDLSAYPPGLYHAVVRTAQGMGHVRLMVAR